jgi:hypothetical protein
MTMAIDGAIIYADRVRGIGGNLGWDLDRRNNINL